MAPESEVLFFFRSRDTSHRYSYRFRPNTALVLELEHIAMAPTGITPKISDRTKGQFSSQAFGYPGP